MQSAVRRTHMIVQNHIESTTNWVKYAQPAIKNSVSETQKSFLSKEHKEDLLSIFMPIKRAKYDQNKISCMCGKTNVTKYFEWVYEGITHKMGFNCTKAWCLVHKSKDVLIRDIEEEIKRFEKEKRKLKREEKKELIRLKLEQERRKQEELQQNLDFGNTKVAFGKYKDKTWKQIYEYDNLRGVKYMKWIIFNEEWSNKSQQIDLKTYLIFMVNSEKNGKPVQPQKIAQKSNLNND